MMRFVFISAVSFALPALAQNADIQKLLIQRDQQSAAFGLQLRQSVEAAKVPPANRATIESKQLWDRQQLENLGDRQLLQVRPETPDALRPYERLKADEQRRIGAGSPD